MRGGILRCNPMRLGEIALISDYLAPLAVHPGAFGLKDDAALLTGLPASGLAITADGLVAGVHFFEDDDPADVAYKALAVNVSDLAAKAARPLAYTLTLALTEAPTADWAQRFTAGLSRAQDEVRHRADRRRHRFRTRRVVALHHRFRRSGAARAGFPHGGEAWRLALCQRHAWQFRTWPQAPAAAAGFRSAAFAGSARVPAVALPLSRAAAGSASSASWRSVGGDGHFRWPCPRSVPDVRGIAGLGRGAGFRHPALRRPAKSWRQRAKARCKRS